MAQRVITQLVSDLSGEDIAEGNGQTIKFGWLGAEYTIDLTDKEVEKFAKVIEPFVSVATKTGGRRSTGSSGPKSDHDPKAVRAWATENGIEVPARGRIPAEVVEKWRDR